MVSRTGQEIHLKQYPKGMPTEDIFELVKVDLPEPKEGEFLVRNVWMSVDPYMRGRMRSPQETKSYISSFQLNTPLDGACVGQIVESKNKDFRVGEYVLGNYGWRENWLSNGNDILKINEGQFASKRLKFCDTITHIPHIRALDFINILNHIHHYI